MGDIIGSVVIDKTENGWLVWDGNTDYGRRPLGDMKRLYVARTIGEVTEIVCRLCEKQTALRLTSHD